MNHIIRIKHDALRRVLLCLALPLSFAGFVLDALFFYPHALCSFRFYELAWCIFWLAWDGHFVGSEA